MFLAHNQAFTFIPIAATDIFVKLYVAGLIQLKIVNIFSVFQKRRQPVLSL